MHRRAADGGAPVTGLRAERAAEVIVCRAVGGEDRGSGYLVRDGTVLTAEHVVRRAVDIRVRFEADRPAEWTARAHVLWSDARCDVALLALERDGAGPGRRVRPTRFGAVRETDTDLRSSALGFPLFKLRDDPGGATSYRDSCHARGRIAPLADRRERTLELRVQEPEWPPERRCSPWEGMSGAAVWAHGRIVGVVTMHRREEGFGTLTVSRADGWFATADEAGRRALRRAGVVPALRPAVPWWRNRRLLLGTGAGTLAVTLAAWSGAARLTEPPPLRFRIVGACDHAGRQLDNESAGFTPGGRYTNEILAPDGQALPLGASGESGTVAKDGSVHWSWPCASTDAKGTYRARVTDETTHRRTGWVPFTIGQLTPYTCAFRQENGLWYAGISRTVTAVLAPGASDPDDVAEAQCLLRRLGFPLGARDIDGRYGSYTQQAVSSLQTQGGLTPDGIVGPSTWKVLRTRTPSGS
ncbi:peptidoglycan-binding protein [Kitasatospora sp. NPDC059648]|uniref:peptidoglycan-binding protein n=1 Tax=Kitasatospora sp. NPDC059648 TaxID=3346894 RepID=UPI0036A2F417